MNHPCQLKIDCYAHVAPQSKDFLYKVDPKEVKSEILKNRGAAR